MLRLSRIYGTRFSSPRASLFLTRPRPTTLFSLTTMSDYDFRPGSSLKLKGVAEGGVVKR